MNIKNETKEISEECWKILNKSPDNIMCSNSRMVVKKKEKKRPLILACTLVTNDKDFELGYELNNSKKTTYLKHKYCSQFCVLGNSSCTQ